MGQGGRGHGGRPKSHREGLVLALCPWPGPCPCSLQLGGRLVPWGPYPKLLWPLLVRIKPDTFPGPHSPIFLAAGWGPVTLLAHVSTSVGQNFGKSSLQVADLPGKSISSFLLPEQGCDGWSSGSYLY